MLASENLDRKSNNRQ